MGRGAGRLIPTSVKPGGALEISRGKRSTAPGPAGMIKLRSGKFLRPAGAHEQPWMFSGGGGDALPPAHFPQPSGLFFLGGVRIQPNNRQLGCWQAFILHLAAG